MFSDKSISRTNEYSKSYRLAYRRHESVEAHTVAREVELEVFGEFHCARFATPNPKPELDREKRDCFSLVCSINIR